jgi:hypothetical protein
MSKVVIYRDRQEIQAADLGNTGANGQAALDHVVKDAVLAGKGWSDFQVLETGTAEITVKPGRIYNAGAVYLAEADTVFDLLSVLPAVNQKWVGIVGFGATVDIDIQPRDFLIDVTTGATEPSAVAMQRLRKANIATVAGVEAPQPAKPAIAAENVIIAWALLDATGVVSISINGDARVPNTFLEKLRTDDLFAWRAAVGSQIESLRSDLAAIKALLAQRGDSSFVQQIAFDVARVKEALELEDGYTSYDADRFLDVVESDTTNVNFLAKVEEGIRFSNDAANQEALEVFNPVNPDVIISSGFLLPKYVDLMRFRVGPYFESIPIAQYPYQSHSMVQRTMSRTRIRYGEETTQCTNSAWWRAGRLDPVSNIFTRGGETFEVVEAHVNGSNHFRLRRFWIDTYEEKYWDRITVDYTVQGSQIGQTYLNGADGWLSAIGLFFTAKGATGNVDVSLCLTKYGQPDLENVLNKVTLDVADILVAADGSIETKVPFPATYLEAGKRYAIVLTTGGNHYVAMAQGTQYAQGSFFYNVDGAYQMGTATKDLCFSLYFAKFNRTRTIVELESMSLSGGIALIDILAPMIVPGSCDLTFEVQVAGEWSPLAEVTSGNTVLYGLPPLLPFRAVFTGTTDVQAGVNLAQSSVRYSRPRTTFKHISNNYTLGTGTQSFKVVAIIENYKEANHDLTCTIRANGAGGEINPATTVDELLDPPADARSVDHKRIRRTFTWTPTQITSAMSSVRVTLNGATSSALDTWHVAERVHLAF